MKVSINNDSVIESVTGDSFDVSGYEPEELIGQPVDIIIPPRMRDAHNAGMSRYKDTGQKKAMGSWMVVPLQRKDGRLQNVSFCVVEEEGQLTATLEPEHEAIESTLSAVKDRRLIDAVMSRAKSAAAEFARFDADRVDRIVKAVADAAQAEAEPLAIMACEETGMGKVADKTAKNLLASRDVYDDIKDMKTVGIRSETDELIEHCTPMGPILCIIPVTNPTATTIFKILVNLKARNPVVICPARKAAGCVTEATRICRDAAIAAGAPENCIQVLTTPSRALTNTIMQDSRFALILATGGAGLVRSAYSSGTPALGVGAGNVPVFVADDADIIDAASKVIASKNFDNGVICASEQAIVCTEKVADQLRQALIDQGAHLLTHSERPMVSSICIPESRGSMNPDIVGQPASYIAERAGIDVPPDTSLLVLETDVVGPEEPLSQEVLAPVIALYVEFDEQAAIERCKELACYGGLGHTAVIYTHDRQKIMAFSAKVDAGRIVVNQPSSQAAVGMNNDLHVSFTLGCGTHGKNITTDNITAHHLVNVERITLK